MKSKYVRKNQLTKLNECLSKLNTMNDKRKFLIQGLISYNNNKLNEAFRNFEEGSKLGDPKSMYQYAKMHFLGEGTNKNVNEAIRYFTKSQDEGYKKSEYFLKTMNTFYNKKEFSAFPAETQLIFIENSIKNIQNNSGNEFSQIILQPNQTEKLFFNKSLKSSKLYEFLKLYNNMSIEIEFPSTSFKPLVDLVIKIKNKSLKELKIGIVYTSTKQSILKLSFSKEISYCIIDSSIKEVYSVMFRNCSNLNQITFNQPSFVTEIGNESFYKCTSLKEITIPSSVTEIGNKVFKDCTSLEKVIIQSSSLPEIKYSSFSGCSSLWHVTIPKSVKIIEYNAFYGCKRLRMIELPSSLTIINCSVFTECSSLEQITIPSTVTEIRQEAFYKCSSLDTVLILGVLDEIGKNAFSFCPKLTNLTIHPIKVGRVKYYENKMLVYKEDPQSDAYVTLNWVRPNVEIINIPTFIKKIESRSFSQCSLLKQIIIPSFVTEIGEGAFIDCTSLEKVEIQTSMTSIKSSTFYGCSSLTIITIPSSVVEIENYAFAYCSSLKQIKIPSSVVSFHCCVFTECSSLTKVDFEEPSSLKAIGGHSFELCTSLNQISLPSSVEWTSKNIFDGCSSLKEITIPSCLSKKLKFEKNVKVKKI